MIDLAVFGQHPLAELKVFEKLPQVHASCIVAVDEKCRQQILQNSKNFPEGFNERLFDLGALIAGSLTPPDGATYVYVCTTGDEAAAVRDVEAATKLKAFGLFRDGVMRRAARARWLVEESAIEVSPELKYAIICLPRSGSTFLGRELKSLGLGDPIEHLRPFVAHLAEHKDQFGFDVLSWLRFTIYAACQNGVLGTKVISSFAWRLVPHLSADEREQILQLLSDFKVVYLIRRNKFDQAVSDFIAEKSNVWHLWNQEIEDGYAEKLSAISPDIQDLARRYRWLVEQEQTLGALLDQRYPGHYVCDYDDLCERPKQCVAQVAEFLGRRPPEKYLETPLSLKRTTTDVHRALSEALQEHIGAATG